MSLAFLILLPILLSGYVFCMKCHFTYYNVLRLEGYHLYFRAARDGLYFLVVSITIYLIIYALSPPEVIQVASKVKDFFNQRFNLHDSAVFEVSIVALFSIAIARILAWVVNAIVPAEYSYQHAISNDDFELLLHKAMTEEKTTAVSMENGKVYVGWIVRTFEPREERKFLRLLPVMSGYRNETGKVKFTTFYDPVIESVERHHSYLLLTREDFDIVFPMTDIKSISLFDVEAYLHFQDLHEQ